MDDDDGKWWMDDWWCFLVLSVFYYAREFTSDLSTWNTSRVTNMQSSKLSFLYCVVYINKHTSLTISSSSSSSSSFCWWLFLYVFFFWWMMMMNMGNDGWMIDDVFWFCQCLETPKSSTLIWENGTLQESRICTGVSCLSSIVLYI